MGFVFQKNFFTNLVEQTRSLFDWIFTLKYKIKGGNEFVHPIIAHDFD